MRTLAIYFYPFRNPARVVKVMIKTSLRSNGGGERHQDLSTHGVRAPVALVQLVIIFEPILITTFTTQCTWSTSHHRRARGFGNSTAQVHREPTCA